MKIPFLFVSKNVKNYALDISINNNASDIEIVLNLFTNNCSQGGLADRLRGILTTYAISKELKIDYKLFFDSPFPLIDFLVPAQINWMIDYKDILFSKKTDLIVCEASEDSSFQRKKQYSYLKKKLQKSKFNQMHVYTNSTYSYSLNYGELFFELFKPSDRLKKSIDNELNKIGEKYFSISCRFLNLLGDFNEPCGYEEPLEEQEKNKLITRLIHKICDLHEKNPEFKFLINSDSVTFLEKVKILPFVYAIDGNVTHIDNVTEKYQYENYEKIFLDFFLISMAEKIFLLKSSKMYSSGFPYAASRLYNKQFCCINI